MSPLITLSYLIKAKFRRKQKKVNEILVQPSAIASFLLLITILYLFIHPIDCWSSGDYPRLPVPEPACDSTECIHGSCLNNRCVCDFGWQGSSCDQCGGRIKLNSSFGYITDGKGNYSSDLKCTWLIDSDTTNATIRLQIDFFETECLWDHLYIFDGDSINAPMLAVLSGSLVNENTKKNNSQRIAEITAKSGKAYLYFYSDAAYNMNGFNITYSINSCPRNCSNHGVCVGDQCTCDAEYEGLACEKPICPNGCSGHGICDRTEHKCICNYGYVGIDCSLLKHEGYWLSISATNIPNGRALHKAVIYEDSMFVVGGEYFNYNESFIIKYDMKQKKWDDVPVKKSIQKPTERFGHSLVVYRNTLYVYGGILRNGAIVSELWAYGIDNESWTRVHGSSNTDLDYCCPIASTGHTATVVNNIMVVIFGYNPTYGYLNYVQHYDLNENEWKLVKATGAGVRGGFGHTSTYDHISRLIYVFGGYRSASFTDNVIVDFLYGYDPKKESWSLLSPSNHPRYLHSASLINGLILIYGGNAHSSTDSTNDNTCFNCFSPIFLAYDISCDTWTTLENPVLSNTFDDTLIGRFGHSSIVYDDSLYIFGGFNGILHNRLMRYLPGNCSNIQTSEECFSKKIGTKCVWNKEKRSCQSYNPIKPVHNHCDESLQANFIELCHKQYYCSSCLKNSYDCVWCGRSCTHKKCSFLKTSNQKEVITFKGMTDERMCDSSRSNCNDIHNCHSCQLEPRCLWRRERICYNIDGRLAESKRVQSTSMDYDCETPCYIRARCESCTMDGSCMWCNSQQRCIESNAYSSIYPIGQCMEWTTHSVQCTAISCSDIQSCDKCLKNPQCGWCNYASNNGTGICLEGSLVGPNDNASLATCSKWHFISCPECQCNGHSKCSSNPSICDSCQDNTEGDHCEFCRSKFYGNPINGGTCQPCSCNGHSEYCNRETGKCSCTTKGIIGHHCEKCEERDYVGNPQDPESSCYYNLSTSYSYTFNMSKPDDKSYTKINFINIPLSPEIDIEFSVQCQGSAMVNISVGSNTNSYLGSIAVKRLYENLSCGNIKLRFPYLDLDVKNATFLVNVYSFKTPFLLQISFSQHRNIDILHFFLTFSGCFLTLLLVAAILWKIKQKYELYMRRQQLFVELEQMASRPFAGVVVQVVKENESPSNNEQCELSDPSPIALEPCANGKAAVLTLLIKLPNGNQLVPQPGQTGIALASALVTLGHNCRKDDKEKNITVQKQSTNSNKLTDNPSFSTGV